MGPTTAALAQFILSLVAEGIREATFALAFHTLDLNIRHFARGSKLTEPKLIAAVTLAPVDEFNPGEIQAARVAGGDQVAPRPERSEASRRFGLPGRVIFNQVDDDIGIEVDHHAPYPPDCRAAPCRARRHSSWSLMAS